METRQKEIRVTIKGTTPLLFNRFRDASIEGKSKRKAGAEIDLDIKDKLYLTEDKKAYIPSRYFERAMTIGGQAFKGKGRGNLSTIIGSMLSIEPDAIILNNQNWKEDIQAGVNPMTRGRTMIHRPRFDKWGGKMFIKLDIDEIPTVKLKEMLDYVGLYVGIGDWRPAKKGKYGKFIVSKFKEI